MTDPQHFGLGELGQRVQAMSEPVQEPRLRPYQGAPLPAGPPTNGRSASPSAPGPSPSHVAAPAAPCETREEVRAGAPPLPASPVMTPYTTPYTAPSLPSAEAESGLPLNSGAPSSPLPGAEPLSGFGSGSSTGSGAGSTSGPSSMPSSSQHALPDPNAPRTSGFQRAINAVRATLPLVQKLLPLLDGNFATAVGSFMASQPSHHTPPPPVRVDLEPIERGLSELKNSHRELRVQVQEQVTSLKRVEDHLERVREATDRNTLEQQELVEDLRSVGSRMSTFAIVGLVLLVISLGLNIWLLIQLQHILR